MSGRRGCRHHRCQLTPRPVRVLCLPEGAAPSPALPGTGRFEIPSKGHNVKVAINADGEEE